MKIGFHVKKGFSVVKSSMDTMLNWKHILGGPFKNRFLVGLNTFLKVHVDQALIRNFGAFS